MMHRDWGWDDSWAEKAAETVPDALQVARVVGQDRGSWSVQSASGPLVARLPSASMAFPTPVVGDWVFGNDGPTPTDPWSIQGILPRRSVISRGSPGTGRGEQVLAANVDTVWIVHGLDRPVNSRSIERYLSVVWESGATPEVVLTKGDLADDPEAMVAQAQSVAMGVPVRSTSSEDPESIAGLRASLAPGRTVSLLGPSGVGKSTLVNLLAEASVAATGAVRVGDKKGRHTTTRRELFRIPGGALLLDTPGMREFRIGVLDEGIKQAFPEIEALAGTCRFRDCKHENEPGCAVLEAVEGGELDHGRLASFRKLQAEAAYEARRSDPLARAAALSDWKTSLKTLKYHPKHKREK